MNGKPYLCWLTEIDTPRNPWPCFHFPSLVPVSSLLISDDIFFSLSPLDAGQKHWMGTLNSVVKELDRTSKTIQCRTSELPQCVQVDPEELVEKLLSAFVGLAIFLSFFLPPTHL